MRSLLSYGLLIAVLVGSAACSKVDEAPIQNLNGGHIAIVGHAGSGFESALNPFPSNTLTSIRQTLEGYNADGVEVDVQLSADSVLLLYHDPTLESMTECSGYIREKLAANVTGCHYRTDFNSHILQDERILPLTAVLDRYRDSPLRPTFYFDLKEPDAGADRPRYYQMLARRLAEVVRRYDLLDRVYFEAGNAPMLLAVRSQLPGARLLIDEDDFEKAMRTVQANQLMGIVARTSALTAEQVRTAHNAGYMVILYLMIRRNEVMEAINKNPDGVQTDNILLTQQIVAARKG